MSAVPGSFSFDDTRWPIVVQTFVGELDDAQIDSYVEAGTKLVQRGEPFSLIVDARRCGWVSAYARSRAIQWQQAHREEMGQHCRGVAYVISSPVLRFVAMTVFLIGRMPMPCTVCESFEDALAWVQRPA